MPVRGAVGLWETNVSVAGKYDFELLVDGAVTAARRSIYLPDLKAAWPLVSAMADDAQRGAKIRVLDKDGRIVILTGVTAARILSRNVLAA
jgi:hypothetical protein